jgi:hypothetical protein
MIGSMLFSAKGRSDGATLSDVIRASLGILASDRVRKFDKKTFDLFTDDELIPKAVDDLKINPLKLDRANSTSSITARTLEVTNNFGERAYADGVEVTTTVPFTGDAALFELCPNQHDLSKPHGKVSGQKLAVGVALPSANKDSAIPTIKSTLDSVERYIDNQRSQIETFNSQLEDRVRPLVAARRAEFESHTDLLSKLSGI